ncbi:uncharacterized protein K444DRAFT_612408 [Hyaloscypha bicolor E]|uniref:Leucine-rich repeat domain-containing protein n=1 Tax=Hyaloscypha bicolor E TaxID=1095630 RepID=A0A2J6TCG1_9HELO|nr:uncharacterized protein K444DRAFT_612408 [Hyaloscypha bicolor E]PMD60710.1 hypothetical protein K444DRAFT_612408 [Hyaloscypha bicolor E]
MSLYKLSDDILLEIAEWVNTNGYIPDYSSVTERGTKFLASLVLCSRRLNSIATPVLYRTFVQTKYGALPAFLRTILEKPQLGALVKDIVVSEIDEEESMEMGGLSRQEIERLGLRADVLDHFESEMSNWIDDLEAGKWQAVAALLILLLPGLEEIVIASYHGPDLVRNGYINTALAYAAHQQLTPHSQQALKNLKTVSMAYCDTESGMSMEAILPFCALPSVTAARIHMASDDEFTPSSQRYQTKDLQINSSNIASGALINILRCFPDLKKLFYENGGSIVGCEDFLPQYLGRAIEHLKGCLEELTVLDQGGYMGNDEEQEAIGSLAGFQKLRRVAMDYDCLLKADSQINDENEDEDEGDGDGKPRLVNVLPPSLEFLAVARCEPDILDQIRELLEQQKHGERSNFPLLEKVIIGFVDKPNVSPERISELRRVEEELVADGKEMGIEVVIVHPKFQIGGRNADFEAAFHFDGVWSP